MPINEEHITILDLSRCQQSGNRVDHKPLNGALQVACSVALVGTFSQEKCAPFFGDSKLEPTRSRVQHAPLHIAQLDLENFVQVLAPERMEHYNFVQTIHEFR